MYPAGSKLAYLNPPQPTTVTYSGPQPDSVRFPQGPQPRMVDRGDYANDFETLILSCSYRMNVINATYGAGTQMRNVTNVVQSKCNGTTQCEIKAVPSEFGGDLGPGDPAPGKQKTLRVFWSCAADGNPTSTKRMDESFMTSSGKWWIIIALIVIALIIWFMQSRKRI